MAAVHYKLKYYKGCPGITILHVVLDLAGIAFHIMGIGLLINSFSNGNIGKGIIWTLATIIFCFGYFKLTFKLENLGRTVEAKRKEQREYLLKSASTEEIAMLAKQEKKEDIFMVAGIIISIIIVVPIIAVISILCCMYTF